PALGRARWPVLALLAASAAIYVAPQMGASGYERYDAFAGALIRRSLLDPSVSPAWWVVAGALGLLVGRLPLRPRIALAAATLLLGAAYLRLGFETNPLFGAWRYLIGLTPLLAVGAAALLARVPLPRRETALAALAVGALLATALHRRILW